MPNCHHDWLRQMHPAGRCAVCQPHVIHDDDPEPPRTLADMEPWELAALNEQAKAEKARRSFSEFVRQGWHVLESQTELEWNWHHDAICDHMQWLFEDWLQATTGRGIDPTNARGGTRAGKRRAMRAHNLLINVPPGSLKSRIVSVYFPAWAWVHAPHWQVVCLSSNPDVANRDSMYCREVIASEWYQGGFTPQWEFDDRQDTKGKFANTAGGFRQCRGLNATITGIRGHWLLVDDPHDAQDAHSDTKRKQVHDKWYLSCANRVNDEKTAVRVMIMQRLHSLDLAGHWLSKQECEHLCIPEEFDPELTHKTIWGWEDPRAQNGGQGTLMHPARTSAEMIPVLRKRLGSFGYASQHGQRPAPAEGGLFKRQWWRWFRSSEITNPRQRPAGCSEEAAIAMPKMDWVVVTVDANFKKTEDGSAVAILVIGGKGPDRFVMRVITKQMGFHDTKIALRSVISALPSLGVRHAKVLIEDKANGPAIVDDLRREFSGIVSINPEGGKEARAWAVSPAVESGNVYLLDGAPWVEAFVFELAAFPKGARDDMVDAFSQALNHMAPGHDVVRARMLCS